MDSSEETDALSGDAAGSPDAVARPGAAPDPGETRALFDLPLDELVNRARETAARSAAALGDAARPVGASPIILSGACMTRPGCRHCKWEHFKALGRGPFVLDATREEAVAAAHRIADGGVRRAFTATGWMGYRLPARFIAQVAAIHEAEPRLELYGLFGALDRQSHLDLAAAGMKGMLTGLESPSETVYRSFRPGGDGLQDRLRALDFAHEAGLEVWTGFLVGLGETAEDCARGIGLIGSFEPESVSILPFEPYPDTAMASHPACDPAWLARVNAVARVALPGVAHFFTDHSDPFGTSMAERLGLNGSYETGR